MTAALVVIGILKLGLRLELGPEFDSNANHVEVGLPVPPLSLNGTPVPVEPVSAFLVRGSMRGRLAWSSGPTALRLSLDLGGKYFFGDAAAPQNTGVVRAGAEVRTTVSRFTLALAADYHDALQWNACPDVLVRFAPDPKTPDQPGLLRLQSDTSCHRDFRLAAVRADATVAGRVPSLTFEAAVRQYQWKADEEQTFLGAGGALLPALHFRTGEDETEAEWTLAGSARVEWRRYFGPVLNSTEDPGGDGLARRADTVVTGGLTLTWVGPLLASAGYVVERDFSTSGIGSYLYQAVALQLAMSLPGKLTMAMKAQLLFFSSGILPTAVAVEDENRDAVLVELSRPLGKGFTARARYSGFRNAGGQQGVSYDRQVIFLGATWETK